MGRPQLDEHTTATWCSVLLEIRVISNALNERLERRFPLELTQNSAIAVLSHLAANGPTRPRDLQQETGLTSGGLSKLLDRLEQLRLVARRTGVVDDDGRATLVSLTHHGRSTERALVDLVGDSLREVNAHLKQLWLLLGDLHLTAQPVPVDRVGQQRVESSLTAALARLGVLMSAALTHFWADDERSDHTAALVLCALALEPNLRPRQLMDRLGLSSGGVTKLVDRLVEAGLAERTYGAIEHDRRAVSIAITPRGRRVLETGLAQVSTHGIELATAFGATMLQLGVHPEH